jgi:DNA-directed RNA polymerase II subunit RPB1
LEGIPNCSSGDEMNMHVPQSLQSAVELLQIAAIPKQIISAAKAAPIITPVQDTLIGFYKITGKGIKFNRREMLFLMTKISSFNGELPEPHIEGADGVKRFWSGHQAVSMILPEINIKTGDGDNVLEIVQGQMIRGQVDKKTSSLILHIIYNDFGAKAAKDYLNNLQFLMTAFLIHEGYSVGVGDLVVDPRVKKVIKKVIDKGMAKVNDIYQEIHQGTFGDLSFSNNAEAFEAKIGKIGGEVVRDVENLVISTAKDNRILQAINSGSKGTSFHFASMTGIVGPQAVDAKRIPSGFSDKTRSLPHYYKYDDSLIPKGFVSHSFIDGLDPQEFFFHAMGGREGLIDTAVKTAESGYIQRRLMKALEDMKVHYDYTVRSANGDIYQFLYGEDGINGAGLLERQSIGFLFMPYDKLNEKYRLSPFEKWELYMKEPAVKRLQKTKDWKERLEQHFKKMNQRRDYLVNKTLMMKYETSVISPVNIERLITNIKAKFQLNDTQRSDLTPFEVEEEIEKLMDDLQINGQQNNIMSSIVMFSMCPKEMIFRHRFNKTALNYITQYIRSKYQQTRVSPGEMVGPLAAQSIGEVSTQLTLNTFHTAGKASAVTTGGVARLKELMANSKKIKTPSIMVYLDEEYRKDKTKALNLRNNLELTTIGDIVSSISLYLDNNLSTDIDADKSLIDIYKMFGEITDQVKDDNPWILRVKFSRDKMMERNITMNDLYLIIQYNFSNINCIYNDDNAGELIMRLKIEFDSDSNNADKDINKMREFEQKFTSTIVKGVPGISHVLMDKIKDYVKDSKDEVTKQSVSLAECNIYVPDDEWILITKGSNLEDVLIQDHVDASRTISNDVIEVYEMFGIEAARNIIYREFHKLIGINYRHVGLLADFMTNKGYIMPIDRHGINRGNAGPLAKSSFEETIDQLLQAGVHGKVDNMDGVSANIMMGQIAPAGTGFPQILLDEKMMVEEMKKRPPKQKIEKVSDQEVVNKYMNIPEFCQDNVGINFDLDNIPDENIRLSNIPKVEIE